MPGTANDLFSKMFGTLAVILVVSAFIGGSELLTKFRTKEKTNIKYYIIAGLLGGIFGIYGNISGVNISGAVVSVRDVGPMLAGFTGGPVAGILAGAIAGIHRLTLGGDTAHACIVATCSIGLMCGLLSTFNHKMLTKPYWAFLTGAVMECFHLSVVLVMVKPFSYALGIVKDIAIPFIIVNALGFAMMIAIITYIEKQRELSAEKSRLQSELEVATTIQRSMLPNIGDEYPGAKELNVAAFMEAAKEVGGDFYDAFFVDSGRIALVIGDVSGKGVPAALFMATAKTTLQNCVRDIPSLSGAVETANNALCARNEAGMFVTLWVGILELATGEITFVSAGHNPPAIISDGRVDFVKVKNGFVLAGMEDMFYKEHTAKLNPGETILLYTDGVVEAETSGHKLFGDDRLLECLAGKENENAAGIIETVKASVDDFIEGNDQFDDMTMLCAKYLGPAKGEDE